MSKMYRKIWGRLGADLVLTDAEYDQFVRAAKNNDNESSSKVIEKAVKEGRMKLRGETYFPESGCFGGSVDEYDNWDSELSCEI